jgi:hypothetical protein
LSTLLTTSKAATTAAGTTSVSTLLTSITTTAVATSLWAVSGDVSNLGALYQMLSPFTSPLTVN